MIGLSFAAPTAKLCEAFDKQLGADAAWRPPLCSFFRFSMDLLLPRQRIVKVHEVGAHRLLAHDGLHIEVDLTAHVALGDRA